MAKAIIDKTLEKIVSRKLTVFAIGTVFLITGVITDQELWMQLAMVYIGTQGAVDIVKEMRK